ncbi:uncharacterized protein GJ701_011928 [Geothlypis trichas]
MGVVFAITDWVGSPGLLQEKLSSLAFPTSSYAQAVASVSLWQRNNFTVAVDETASDPALPTAAPIPSPGAALGTPRSQQHEKLLRIKAAGRLKSSCVRGQDHHSQSLHCSEEEQFVRVLPNRPLTEPAGSLHCTVGPANLMHVQLVWKPDTVKICYHGLSAITPAGKNGTRFHCMNGRDALQSAILRQWHSLKLTRASSACEMLQ